MVGEGDDVQLVNALMVKSFCFISVAAWLNFNQCGIRFAQGEGITVNHHFHRVAQGRIFHQLNDGIGNESHVQEMLSALAFSVNSLNTC